MRHSKNKKAWWAGDNKKAWWAGDNTNACYTDRLTPEQRLEAVSKILARGVLRLIESKRRQNSA